MLQHVTRLCCLKVIVLVAFIAVFAFVFPRFKLGIFRHPISERVRVTPTRSAANNGTHDSTRRTLPAPRDGRQPADWIPQQQMCASEYPLVFSTYELK
eukprot:763085-Pleurochrysis_carterae.AAC.1